jgi:hypothetical protein
MRIDPAFGIVVTQWVDGTVQILHAEEYHRPDYNEMLSVAYGLISIVLWKRSTNITHSSKNTPVCYGYFHK